MSEEEKKERRFTYVPTTLIAGKFYKAFPVSEFGDETKDRLLDVTIFFKRFGTGALRLKIPYEECFLANQYGPELIYISESWLKELEKQMHRAEDDEGYTNFAFNFRAQTDNAILCDLELENLVYVSRWVPKSMIWEKIEGDEDEIHIKTWWCNKNL